MITSQKGEALSKIISKHKNKEERKHKISASFQQLYDILSKKSNTDDISRIHYNSVPKARLTKQIVDQKLQINIQVQKQNGLRKDSSHMQTSTFKEDTHMHLKVMLQAYYKQRGSLTPNEKKSVFSMEKTNERLKNIILGKNKKSKMFQDKNSFQQQIIQKCQKLQQITKHKLQVKRSITQNSQHSNYKLDYQEHDKIKIRHTKIVEQKEIIENPNEKQEKKATQGNTNEVRYKKFNNKKKLMIRGCHLQNILKFSYQEPEITKNQQSKDSPNMIQFKSHLNNFSTYMQPIKQSKMISPANKFIKDDEKQSILTKFQPQLLVSEHILCKLQKIFNFHQFFLQLFNCQMSQHQTPTQLLKYSRKSNYLRYYVGNGNNRTLIVETMDKRWWWKQTSKMNEADFVWTQQKLIKLYSKSSKHTTIQQHPEVKSDQQFKLKSQNLKLIDPEGSPMMKKLLLHSFKAKRKAKEHNPYFMLIDRPTKLHNHLIDSHILGDKKNLFKLLKLWKTQYKNEELSNLYKIIPETFHIISQRHEEYLLLKQKIDNNIGENNLWIVKPGQNSNRGRGIFLSNSLDQITQSINVRSELKGTTIVQKYKSDLLLYKGRKFDIRAYLLCIIIGGNCKFFWYSQGYIRTSSHPYSTTELNSMIHLTNDAIQNTGDQYGKYQKGNKLSYNQLQNYINQIYPKEEWKVQQLTNHMKQIAKIVAISSYYLVDKTKKQHGFQLFGMDFIVDSQFNPFLLQVNTNPCIELSSPLLQTIIPNLIENVCRLGLDPLFPPNMLPDKQHQYCLVDKIIETNRFQLIFDSLTERDQTWQKFCDQHWVIE